MGHMVRSLVVLVLALPAFVSCGSDVDVVDGPFIYSWDLTDELTLTVSNHPGTADASCVIYPYDNEGEEMRLDGIADLLPGDGYHEVFVSGPFSITGGETIVFDVDLPEVDDPDFWRWQVDCDPGAPG